MTAPLTPGVAQLLNLNEEREKRERAARSRRDFYLFLLSKLEPEVRVNVGAKR